MPNLVSNKSKSKLTIHPKSQQNDDKIQLNDIEIFHNTYFISRMSQ